MGAALDFFTTELRRTEALARTQTASVQALDRARYDAATNEAALASAEAQLEVRRSVRESLAARLLDPSGAALPSKSICCVQIRSPVTGRILKIVQESEEVVQAGAPLIEVGDPLDLEIVADLLSTDAVQIREGAPVRIDGWGGPPLRGQVTRIDPAGFLKVSALGIEEQRVHVTMVRQMSYIPNSNPALRNTPSDVAYDRRADELGKPSCGQSHCRIGE
jgi:HlyD family secretion protein